MKAVPLCAMRFLCAACVLGALAMIPACSSGGLATEPGVTDDDPGVSVDPGVVKGTVVGPTGEAIADAICDLVSSSSPGVPIKTTTSGLTGTFGFTAVQIGQSIKVRVQGVVSAVTLRGESGSFQLTATEAGKDVGQIQLQIELPPDIPF